MFDVLQIRNSTTRMNAFDLNRPVAKALSAWREPIICRPPLPLTVPHRTLRSQTRSITTAIPCPTPTHIVHSA